MMGDSETKKQKFWLQQERGGERDTANLTGLPLFVNGGVPENNCLIVKFYLQILSSIYDHSEYDINSIAEDISRSNDDNF